MISISKSSRACHRQTKRLKEARSPPKTILARAKNHQTRNTELIKSCKVSRRRMRRTRAVTNPLISVKSTRSIEPIHVSEIKIIADKQYRKPLTNDNSKIETGIQLIEYQLDSLRL